MRAATRDMKAGNYNSDFAVKAFAKQRNGATGGARNFVLLSWDRPSCTVVKVWTSNNGICHPNRHRFLNEGELKRLGSFPDDFIFPEHLGFKNVVERVGNSVPPNLMKAIALNLRECPVLQEVEVPTVVGLFTGCGGSSLGFELAGWKELLAVEWDKKAAETFRANFPGVILFNDDIASLSVEDALKIIKLQPGELDCLQGSPPCQGFSTAGKRQVSDERNSLFLEYARLLKGLQPKTFVMENVKGLITGPMKQIYLEIIGTLRDCGYRAKGQLLNAQYYDVPQIRERVFIVGIRDDLASRYGIE